MVPGPSTIEGPPAKKSRTNKPWTAAEELRLKGMRDLGKSWSEIAKTFPDRTEGSVKKHWYKVSLSHVVVTHIDNKRICIMPSSTRKKSKLC
jgi:hypothetical protein